MPSWLAVLAAASFERNLWMLGLPALDLIEASMAMAASQRRRLAASAAMVLAAVGLFAGWVPAGWTPAAAGRRLGSPGFWHQHLGGSLPLECMDAIAAVAPGTRLFTLRMWASYIIWSAPQVKVFGDGRNLEYPVELYYAGNEAWEGGPRAEEVLDSTETQLVLAYPGWEAKPGVRAEAWTEVEHGANCAVFKRAR
jgi:hypothetical protein